MKKKDERWVHHCSSNPAIYFKTENILEELCLHTVCESAHCPNQGKCFTDGTATFLLLGNTCTRNCRFCAVEHGYPQPLDEDEPYRISQAVKTLELEHVVLTSVTRDDLIDGGASQFAQTIKAVRKEKPNVIIEVLIPDFNSSEKALQCVLDEIPEVLNHNLETVPRLYSKVRPQADYERSLKLLRRAKDYQTSCFTKSGLMVGLGETHEEVIEVMNELREADCDFLTIGQYLRPSFNHYPIIRQVSQEEFESYRVIGEKMGFKSVFSGRLVRSSFMAGDIYKKALHH